MTDLLADVAFPAACVLLVLYHAFFVWPDETPDWKDEYLAWVRSLPETSHEVRPR